MKSIIVKSTILWVALLSAFTHAEEEGLKTVTSIGVQKENNAYFRVSEGWNVNCTYGVMYFKNNTGFGKAALSTLLAAKSTGKKLSRVVYSQSSSGTCHLSLVEYQ